MSDLVHRGGAEWVRAAAAEHAARHTSFINSARRGKLLSDVMLPLFRRRPPRGFGILTTTGRKSGKRREKCLRIIRRGDVAYLVQLRPPHVAVDRPDAVTAWVHNLRTDPNVTLRLTGGTFPGRAREITDPDELVRARAALVDTVCPFDYGECDVHLRGLPSRAKIVELHGFWFDTGIPIAVDIG